MPTSAADPSIRLVFVDETGAPGRWLLLDGHGVAGRGNGAAPIPPAARTVLAVPGEQVAIHWLDLGEGLAPAQAAAAARLRLADASAEPLDGMHVAVGRPESGLAPAALVPAGRMEQWLASAAAAGLEADAVVPAPLLLVAPETGFYRRDHGALADYRGPNAAFAIEPELAEAVVGDATTQPIGEAAFESRLRPLVADPVLDLRQGAFARRRTWSVDGGRVRRIALFALALALLSLIVQVATILSYTFAADRAEAEAQALATTSRGAAGETGPGFGAAASLLFDAIRATPNAELARIDYRGDGTLIATVTADNVATMQALQQRIEASGLTVAAGQPSNAGGRLTAELTIRAG